MGIFRGTSLPSYQIITMLETLQKQIEEDLPLSKITPDLVIDAADKLSKRLKTSNCPELYSALDSMGFSKEDAKEIIFETSKLLTSQNLYQKLKRELGSSDPFSIKRISFQQEIFEGYCPLGILMHIASSNDVLIPMLTVLEGLLSCNVNILKLPSSGNPYCEELLRLLLNEEPSLCPFISVMTFSSKQTELLKKLFSFSDGVVVWGSKETEKNIRSLVPFGIPVICWGQRISFSYLSKDRMFDKATMIAIAKDICIGNQLSCSAPQCIYLETDAREQIDAFAKSFAEVLDNVSVKYPVSSIDIHSQAEITSVTLLAKANQLLDQTSVIEAPDKSWRVLTEYHSELKASPLYRTIWIKPINRRQLVQTLRPYQFYLQTVGLSCNISELEELCTLLTKCGVSRITRCGEMLSGYAGEPHDGSYALRRYVKRISIQSDCIPKTMYNFSEISTGTPPPFPQGTPILKKEEFSQSIPLKKGYLVLKSGGSSGNNTYALHDYADCNEVATFAAQACFAAGINPKTDICMNLFYSGALYGGFISFYRALEYLDMVQLPMSSIDDLDYVVEEIIKHRVNTLLGMPTYLLKLFYQKHDLLKEYGGIQKIFFGGEHFDKKQIEYLKSEFSVQEIRPCVYGCNEIGSMGYSCEYCTNTIHHVMNGYKYLEILKMDSDEPVLLDEIGRLVWSCCSKKEGSIYRYEIGDLGRWVLDPCPCGRSAPRFELLGRFGDIFKFGTNYINYKTICSILSEKCNYRGAVQLILSYQKEKNLMTIYLQNDFQTSEKEILSFLLFYYPDLNDSIRSELGVMTICFVSYQDFITAPQSGKLKHVIDLRTN